MKIAPLTINNYKNIYHKKESSLITTQQLINKDETISNVYYTPINFYGKLTPTFIQEMQNLKDVRCPICNTKMLNKEQINNAFKDIPLIKTGEQLEAFIEKYREYINPMFNSVLATLSTIIAFSPDEAPVTILETLNEGLRNKTDAKIEQLKKALHEHTKANNTSEEVKKHFTYAEKKLDTLDVDISRMNYYKHISSIIKKAVVDYTGKEKHLLYTQLVEIFKQSVFEENLLIQAENYEHDLTDFFCKKLLSHSLSDLRKVYKDESATEENMLLSCGLCETSDKKFVYSVIKNKNIYYEYIYDMARRALNNEIPSGKSYPILVSENIRNHNSRISADLFQEDLKALYDELGVRPQKEIDFPLVDEPGTPCAYCGQITITHNEKQDLYTRIAKANSLPELLEIANSRKEVIKERYMPIINFAESLGEDINYIDETTFFSELQKQTWRNIEQTLWNAIPKLNRIASDNKLIGEDWKHIQSIIKYIENFLEKDTHKDSDFFPALKFKDFLIEQTASFKDRKELNDAVWDTCYEPIIDRYQLQKILTPIEAVADKLNSGLKAMFQSLFKRSVATIEHLDPKLKYASPKENPDQYKRYLGNRSANLAVACHECNIRKKATDLRLWISNIPSSITHFKNYLKYVKDLQKTKDLKYNPYEVAAQFKALTNKDLLPLD